MWFELQLQNAQNKLMRLILGVHFFNIFHGTPPSYLMNVTKTSETHKYYTRNSDLNLVLPHVKSQGRRGFKFNGIKLWNELHEHIK